jgi:hypothetical protein
VILPLILIFFSAAAATIVAYGTDSAWGQFNHGLDLILWSRRLQWPLIAAALLLCLALLALVISGKRRAWWLIALLPILALFAHRFVTGPTRSLTVAENPAFIDASRATFLQGDDYVVGVRFGDWAYAFPYSVLFHAPAVLQSDREKRMILLWSPFANRALAFNAARDLRGRDLEVVSSPANATLLYNARLGQFINALTGKTPGGEKPTGFGDELAAVKMPWSQWRALNPQSRVMMPLDSSWKTAPAQPLLPRYAMPRSRPELADERRVCVVAATQPIALPSDALRDAPLNLSAGKTAVLLLRQSSDGVARAFARNLDEDLTPRFSTATDPKHPDVALIDSDTNSEWTAAGTAVQGPKEIKGKKLSPVPVEDGLYWGVMKFWYPELRLMDADALAAAVEKPAARDVSAAEEAAVPVKHTALNPKRHRRNRKK